MPPSRKQLSREVRDAAIRRLLAGADPKALCEELGIDRDTLARLRDAYFASESEDRFRSTTPEYHEFIQRRGRKAWPDQIFAKRWIGNYCGCSSGAYSNLCNNKSVAERHAQAFVAMLVENHDHPAVVRCFTLTVEYLGQFGIERLDATTQDAATEHVFSPAVRDRRSFRVMSDYLMGMFGTLADRAHGELDERFVRGCMPADVPDVVDWMYTRVGQCRAPNGPTMAPREAAAFAAAFVPLPRDDYVTRAQEWCAREPWTVVRAWQKRMPYGMSIVLPVSRVAYQDVLTGKRASCDLTAADLLTPSTHIILEAAAETPERTKSDNVSTITWPIAVCMGYQIGAMVRAQRFRMRTAIHFLSFAGTPKNKMRLAKSGFVPRDSYLARTTTQIMEKIVHVGTPSLMLRPDLAAFVALSAVAPDQPRMSDD